jgi:hypothetical protein
MTDDPTTFAGEVFAEGDRPSPPAPRPRRFPRQDSTREQLQDVAKAADSRGLVHSARWLRGEGPRPPPSAVRAVRRVAVEMGCYDADDWMAP